MAQILMILSIAIVAGLLMSRLAKIVKLPAVTAYLVAGLILGPFCIGRIGLEGFGFATFHDVEKFAIISQAALGFIAFTIGNEFRISQLKSMGKRAIVIGVLQAVITTAIVDVVLILLHILRPDIISLPAAITLGSIAAATAPAATLMVIKQYKAHGPMTKLLLMVVAIDDAVGLMLFSISFGVAQAISSGQVSVTGVVVEPIIEIVLSLLLGAVAGILLDRLERYFHSRSKRMSLSIAFVLLTVGISKLNLDVGGIKIGFSLLLTCMMTGTVFCNVCETSDELMTRVDDWTAPINMLFFVLSGAELDLKILSSPTVLFIGLIYIASRSFGKIAGSYLSCDATGCNKTIKDHLGLTLLPQAGVALGMSQTAITLENGYMIRNVVLFSVLVYELIGPTLTKKSLLMAGEIDVEGRQSARKINTEKEPVYIDK